MPAVKTVDRQLWVSLMRSGGPVPTKNTPIIATGEGDPVAVNRCLHSIDLAR